ncbi:aminopeptidase PepB [Algibacillus agarilyticus]|uniref:aminopeptidase PepB n=1 Tax=Algibacillus agarilyticus TaxID=2234133 RepID=UPI000DD06F2F|nr:aminopeptidase PepB [Algibacillus agarilyticus]
MSDFTHIQLTKTSIATGWQANNREQFIADNVYIVINNDPINLLREIQQSARKLENLGIEHACLVGELWDEASQWAFAMGFTCVNKLTNITFTGSDALIDKLEKKLVTYAWSRDLTNQTPAQLYPEKLAQLTVDYITRLAPDFISTKLISGEDLITAGWTGIYNVGKGSVNPPCLLELDYNPSQNETAPIQACLVGKGITFDSGGYSMKSGPGMFSMKCDMGGAAVVAGALALAIQQGLSQRVKLFLCCAENMVSHNAFKLGDILTYKNGVTVEISNTDAEGRLVLADGLMAASETNAPLIIDAATLTGASKVATGGEYTALFSLDDSLVHKAQTLAAQVNEPIWPLPLAKWHQDNCPSAFADTTNSNIKNGGLGGASNAAGFLSRFVTNEKGWLHFDLSAAYHASQTPSWAEGATGQSIALIAELISAKNRV